MAGFTIRSVVPEDRLWVTTLLEEWWAGPVIETRGMLHHADELPGFVAEMDGRTVGLVTYRIDANECEIISFNSLEENLGIGTALLQGVADIARQAGCRRLWLLTTNDNTDALRFYQKRGMHISAVYLDAIEESRKLKPGIPYIGNHGIPLRDEIELEMVL